MSVMFPLLVIAAICVGIVWVIKARRKSRESEFDLYVGHIDDSDSRDEHRDAWEGTFGEATDPKPANAHLKFSYTDGNRNKTTRSVQVREFDDHLHEGILIGHCEMRDATRTFRFDRMRSVIDLETGEAIADVRGYLKRKYEESPERAVEILNSDYVDVLKVVYFMGKADGQYRAEERQIVAGYLVDLINDSRITVDMINSTLSGMKVPSMQAYKLAVGRVLKDGKIDAGRLYRCCQDIVATQTNVHPAEQEALEFFAKKLDTNR